MKLNTYFEDHKSIIDRELRLAKSKVMIAVAWINFEEYLDIFNSVLDNNVSLHIICSDNDKNRAHLTHITALEQRGAHIKMLKMPRLSNHMHHKFVIIDGKTILNGSFNWSPNATRSFENLMVIHECPDEARQFIDEFNRLIQIETASIRKLQRKSFCKAKGCRGDLVNVLVFSEAADKHGVIYGDLIQVCINCGWWDVLESCISDNQLDRMLQELLGAREQSEADEIGDYIMEIMNSYTNNGNITIHAIGKVRTSLNGRDEEEMRTSILWRNKFVGDKVPEYFDEENFEVFYDQEQSW